MKQIEEKFRDRILYRIPLMEYDISGYESIDSVARIFVKGVVLWKRPQAASGTGLKS